MTMRSGHIYKTVEMMEEWMQMVAQLVADRQTREAEFAEQHQRREAEFAEQRQRHEAEVTGGASKA